jgi:hypothetical protein
MRLGVLLVLVCLFAGGCGGKSNQCTRATLGDAASTACRASRAILICPSPNGFECGCVTDEQSCPDCPFFHGSVCRNVCESDEYAVECGARTSDAGPVVVYDDPPPGCAQVARGAGTLTFYCCPCR